MKPLREHDTRELHVQLMRQELAERAHEIAQRITFRIRTTLQNARVTQLLPPEHWLHMPPESTAN
jgi:hypothetical protein